MSEQGSSGEAPGGAAADAIAARARQRHARDKGLVEAARNGDRTAYGKLYDEWVDSVYDRAVHAGASAAEAREITEQTFLTTWRDLGKLKQPAAFGAKVLQVARRETAARVSGGEKIVPKSGASAEDRLTRATSATDTASDPEAAAILREAAHALDEQTREILDLHFRLGLTKNEVAAVLGEQPDKVAQTITKLPPALAVLTRARVLWRGGDSDDDGLKAALAADGVTAFNASAVRTINRYAKDNDRARARSLMGIPPVELFAAIPLADAPAGLKTAVASLLVTESVPMDGSAFVKRDDKGEIVDAPKVPPTDGSVRPGIENTRPSIDPQKAAAVAAAALAAERAADDKTAAEAAAADTAPGRSRRDRKADKNEKAAAGQAAAAAAATDAAQPDSPATDLAARKGDSADTAGRGSGAKIAGAAGAGVVLGAAGAAAASTLGADDTTTFPAADGAAGTDAGTATATDLDGPTGAGGAVGSAAPAAAIGSRAATDATTETEATGTDAGGTSTTGAAATDAPAKTGTGPSKAKTAAAAGAGAAVGATAGAGAASAKAGASTTKATTATGATTGRDAGDGPRAGEKYVEGSGPGKWIAIGVAAVVLIALIAFFATRGGDDGQQVATSGSPNTSAATSTTKATTTTIPTKATTTLLPVVTTEPTETTTIPTTTAPMTPTTKGGGGGGGGGTPTTEAPVTTTEAPTTTISPAKFQFAFDPPSLNFVRNNYDPNADTSPKLSWSVEGDATVTVEGPGFSSTDRSATKRPVCPVPLDFGGRCQISGVEFPKDFAYRITVRQPGVATPQIAQVVLYINE